MFKIDYNINEDSLQEAAEETYFDRDSINFGSFWGDRIFLVDNADLSFYKDENRDGPITWFIMGMWNALQQTKNGIGNFTYTDNHGCGKMWFSPVNNNSIEIKSSLSVSAYKSSDLYELNSYLVLISEFEKEVFRVQKKFLEQVCSNVPYFRSKENGILLEKILHDQ